MSYPGISETWHSERANQNIMFFTVHLKRADLELEFFSAIAMGTPYDISLQDMRIECLFPADEVTEQDWKQINLISNNSSFFNG